MKLIILAFACLALTNALLINPISDANLQTLKSSGSDDAIPDFNEVEALTAFLKGVVSGAALTNSTDVSLCVKGDGVLALFEYYAGLAMAVGNTGATSAVESARKYLSGVGARQLKRVPADLLNCISNSKDFQAITKKFGVDPNSADFGAKLTTFANENPIYFHSTFSAINGFFNTGKFAQAGTSFGTYCRIASFTKTA